jgi:hypothetical protein
MLDAYNRKARLAPAALASFPSALFLIAAAVKPTAESSLCAVGVAALTLLICTLVRDRGRAIEPALWRSWGGPPTSARLRWASDGQGTTRSIHKRVFAATAVSLPDAAAQSDDPVEAERVYEHAVLVLRELTRDEALFPLVAAENAEYGFRRNLFGLRGLGLATATVTLAASAVLLVDGHTRFVLPAVASIIAISSWRWVISPEWVRLAADRYAERLLGAAVTISSESASDS